MLDTDDFRMAAIKTYLNLGFVPVYVEEGQPKRWSDIFEQLGIPSMSAQTLNVKETLSTELWTKISS